MKSRKPRIEPSVAPSRTAMNSSRKNRVGSQLNYLPPEEMTFKGSGLGGLDRGQDEPHILSYIFYVFLAVIVLANFVTSLDLVKFKGFLPSGAYLSYGITATIIAPSLFAGIFMILKPLRSVNRFMLIFATVSLGILFTNVVVLNFMGVFGKFTEGAF